MRLEKLLPDVLVKVDEETQCDVVVLYECKHCGSKFDEERDQCTVCDATEIASYTFSKGCTEHSPVSGSEES